MVVRHSGRLAKVTGKDVAIDPAKYYDGWANTYDENLIRQCGYYAQEIAVGAFSYELQDCPGKLIVARRG